MKEDENPPGENESTERMVGPAEAGATIGPYRLLQIAGQGGMGEVWLAEQKEPVRRRVALKLIKAGMDTREVLARFDSERQALALMDHPAIAKVFEAGSTPEGRPYFAMEYVPGTPITQYCDKHMLSMRERLELCARVCEGVQHAHRKAIIHRDLKPSNILVSEVDGRPLPKIIDFGVAKATAQRLSADTMVTRLGAIVGTLEYMSPEQADSAGWASGERRRSRLRARPTHGPPRADPRAGGGRGSTRASRRTSPGRTARRRDRRGTRRW